MNARAASGALVGLALVAYWGSLDAPYVFDDQAAIVRNENIRQLWPLSVAMSAPPQAPVAGRPVLALSFALNHALTGMDRAGFRAVNVAIVAATALVLFGVVRRTLRAPRMPASLARSADGIAWVSAALWLCHPVLTETVGYLTQRSESLMGLFAITTLYASVRAQARNHQQAWTWASALACALGMATKESMVVVPFAVWLHDRTFFADGFADALRRRPELYIGLAAGWGVLAAVSAGADYENMRMGPEAGVGGLDYLLSQAPVVGGYLSLVIWPYPVLLDFGEYRPVSFARAAAPGALVLTLVAVSLYGYVSGVRRGSTLRTAAGFLGLWWFLFLSPTSSVLPIVGEVGAVRRLYLPLMSATTLAAVAGHALLGRAGGVAVAVIALTLLVGTTRARMDDYTSSIALWGVDVVHAPGNPRAHLNYGNALHNAGRDDEAMTAFRRGLERDPDDGGLHQNLGNLLLQAGEIDRAIVHLEAAARLDPRARYVRWSLGRALSSAGRMDEALAAYRAEMDLQPYFTPPLREAVWILATHPDPGVRRPAEAVDLAEGAVQRATGEGPDPALLDVLAASYAAAGRYGDAVATAERALDRANALGGRGAEAIAERLRLFRRGRPYVSAEAGGWAEHGS